MTKLTKRYPFSASHRLHSPAFTPERNAELYGKCNNPHGHGHNYIVEVTVAGPVDERTGRIADLSTLDSLVRERVVSEFDHRNMNEDIPEFRELVPTTENVAEVIRRRLLAGWPKNFARLDRVRIFETRNNVFEIGNT